RAAPGRGDREQDGLALERRARERRRVPGQPLDHATDYPPVRAGGTIVGMFLLRYVALLALVVWVGGLFALGAIAAPAAFDVMAARQIADGRLLAGAVFGEILRRFFVVSSIAAGVIFL